MNTFSKTLLAMTLVVGAATANAAPAFSAEQYPALAEVKSQRARAEVVAELAAAKALGQTNYGELGPVEVKLSVKPVTRAEVVQEVLRTTTQRAELDRQQRG